MEKETYQRGDLAGNMTFKQRIQRARELMEKAGVDAILLTKPQNMSYLVGDGRLCALAIVARSGATYVGVPKTDIVDTKRGCTSAVPSHERVDVP